MCALLLWLDRTINKRPLNWLDQQEMVFFIAVSGINFF